MLKFSRECIVTGAEQRTKKDGTSYTLVHILGDNGQTLSCMFKGDVNKVFSLKKMNTYNVVFDLTVGQYTVCTISDIQDLK